MEKSKQRLGVCLGFMLLFVLLGRGEVWGGDWYGKWVTAKPGDYYSAPHHSAWATDTCPGGDVGDRWYCPSNDNTTRCQDAFWDNDRYWRTVKCYTLPDDSCPGGFMMMPYMCKAVDDFVEPCIDTAERMHAWRSVLCVPPVLTVRDNIISPLGKPISYKLVFTPSGESVSTPTGIERTYALGVNVILSFDASINRILAGAGLRFTGWTGCDILHGSAPYTQCEVQMNDDRTVMLNFAQQYQLAVNNGVGGSVVSTPAGINLASGQSGVAWFDKNTAITLTATPDSGGSVRSFTGDCSAAQGSTKCSFTIGGPSSVTIAYVIPGKLMVDKLGTGTGTVTGVDGSGNTIIDCGSVCEAVRPGSAVLTAMADSPGSKLVAWGGICSTQYAGLYSRIKPDGKSGTCYSPDLSYLVSATATVTFDKNPCQAQGRLWDSVSGSWTTQDIWIDTITAGSTAIRAVHFTQLKEQIVKKRQEAGLAAYDWASNGWDVANDVSIKAKHITSLRQAINQVYSQCGKAVKFSGNDDPNATTAAGKLKGSAIRARHITDLRNAVKDAP